MRPVLNVIKKRKKFFPGLPLSQRVLTGYLHLSPEVLPAPGAPHRAVVPVVDKEY